MAYWQNFLQTYGVEKEKKDREKEKGKRRRIQRKEREKRKKKKKKIAKNEEEAAIKQGNYIQF